MRSLRWLGPGALLSLAACGGVDRGALDDPGAVDAGALVATDRGGAPVDAGVPVAHTDSGNPVAPVDAGTVAPPMDAGTITPPPVDAGTVTPPPVDAGTVTPPPVDAGSCRACTAFAPVTFCAGTGAGACLSYAGCTAAGCAVCVGATAGGDNCANPIMISDTGQRRTVVTTCGARNDVDTGCTNRTGPDIVIGLRVGRRGRVVAQMTVPAGVSVNYGYDFPATACRDTRTLRACADNGTSTTQGFDLTLDPGTYYLYLATTVASTVVVETNLP